MACYLTVRSRKQMFFRLVIKSGAERIRRHCPVGAVADAFNPPGQTVDFYARWWVYSH